MVGSRQAADAVSPFTLKLSARAISARAFYFRTCSSLQQREHCRHQHHSPGGCDQILGQYPLGSQLLWGFRNSINGFHRLIFQRVQNMLKIGCACMLHGESHGHMERFERDKLILHMPSPPFTLSLILNKNTEL